MTDTSEFLFTYGTLMQGFDNPFAERLRAHSELKGHGYFHGSLYKISWYPGAIYDERSASRVYGEVYQLSGKEALWKELDAYEDVSDDETISLYLRRIIPVTMTDLSVIACWTYLYNQSLEGLSLIPDGDFRKYAG
jgi:gamma-glutamylcyclotransferase (GGCT)/AIG2-like uncharacterized protein YtfP